MTEKKSLSQELDEVRVVGTQADVVKRLLTEAELEEVAGGDGHGQNGNYTQTSGSFSQVGGGNHSQTGGGSYTMSPKKIEN